MSLKAFHVVFISAAILMALAIAVLCLKAYFGQDGLGNLLGAIGAFAGGIALIAYEMWFLKKTRGLS